MSKQKLDTKELLLRIKVLQLAVEIADKREKPIMVAVKNSFRDLADLFQPVPERLQQVLIIEERHGNWYLDGSTEKRLWRSFYEVVKTRNEQNWYDYPDEDQEMPEEPSMTLEEAEGVDDIIANAIHQAWDMHNRNMRERKDNKRQKQWLEKALKSEGKDGSSMTFFQIIGEEYWLESIIQTEPLPPAKLEKS